MTSTIGAEATRRYRFAPLDRAGLLLGLSVTQCALLGAALLLGGAVIQASGSIVFAALPVVVAVGVAFGRWQSRPLHEWIAPVAGWLRLRVSGAHPLEGRREAQAIRTPAGSRWTLP